MKNTHTSSQDNTIVKKTKRPFVLASLMIATFMAAIEGTIVATAMPNIVGDLGGFSLYSWVFSAFLLMTAVTTPVYGKLADIFGRKPIFLFGVLIFLIGSLICGLSTSMVMLVVSRFIQGIGAGAVQPISQTIIGDIYNIEERAKVQGYIASVWGLSAILGPLAGGLIVQYSNWAWIFWINIPLGILGLIGVLAFLHEKPDKDENTKIDYLGSSLIIISITSLMVVFIQGGVAWEWTSLPVILLIILFAITFPLFIWHENRTPSPMMPLNLWKSRLISLANLATLTSGMIMIGLSSFLPTYVQGVMGYSAIVAGFTLTMMSVGWTSAATFAGHIFLRIGTHTTAVIGSVSLFIGGLFFVFMTGDKGPVWAGVGSFFIGIGMGLTSTVFIVSIQNSVDWTRRGIATASNAFMRMLGSALGVAVLGGILNSQLTRFLGHNDTNIEQDISIDSVNKILAGQSNLPAPALSVLKDGLSFALHNVYWGVFIFAFITLVLSLFLPKDKPIKG